MGKLIPALATLAASACSQAATNQSANVAAPAAKAAQPAAAAHGVDDPRTFVAETYAAYRRSNSTPPPDLDHAHSPRLKALFDAYEAAQTPDEVGSLDFDWWVNGQDWEISEPALTETNQGPGRRTIVARFTNMGTPQLNRFGFVRENGRWYLDDVLNESGGEGWTLSALLRERPE